MKLFRAGTILLLLLAGCTDDDTLPDAYGNFEANPTVISSQAAGQLLEFRVREGERLAAGEVVGVIDTTQIALQRDALRAQRQSAAARIANVRAQLGILETKQQIAARERDRFESLVDQGAAPRKQVDDLTDQIQVLEGEMTAVLTQIGAIQSEIEATNAQIAGAGDQIARSVVVNPLDGVVLATFAERFEVTSPGRPLYEIADLDTLFLEAYAGGDQLPLLQIGEPVDVFVDQSDGELRRLPGTISWIASEAEFTPKFIQTREERVNLVYAFKVRVPNPDGALKIGMPGDVRFVREDQLDVNE